jgi:hypothetical protein
MINLAMISVLNRPHELRTHIKGALTYGATRDEIREVFMQGGDLRRRHRRCLELPHRGGGAAVGSRDRRTRP